MDKNDKRRFIEDLTATIAEDLINKIPKMPEEWDGMEIRELLADRFDQMRHMSRRENKSRFRRRLKDYRNETYTRNL